MQPALQQVMAQRALLVELQQLGELQQLAQLQQEEPQQLVGLKLLAQQQTPLN
jgi:hypothetical protein